MSLSDSALLCHRCGRACCPAGPGPGHAAGLQAHTCLLSLVLPPLFWVNSLVFFSFSFFLLPPCPACLQPTPAVLGTWGPLAISTFLWFQGMKKSGFQTGSGHGWQAGPSGQVRRQKEGRASSSRVRVPAALPAARLQASELQRLRGASWQVLEAPSPLPQPWCLGMSVRGRAALGQGRGCPWDGQVWPEDWEPGQGEAGVEPFAQSGRPQAGLGQGRDRCLPQGPSDRLTSSLSGGWSSPARPGQG